MAKIDKPAIEVKNLVKSFKIPLDKGRNLKQKILGRASKGYREFMPLNGISFTINEGEFFGIVGRNGSGKSTLLKTIAGIYTPQKGKVSVNGTLVPFIELGVGFNPQLSGRENVYLNAALLGFSREECDAMYDDIVDFAELHDFMEERLQNYSSGMQVRLAFSIAIRAKGDILLLDEVLAVGDKAFQEKCFNYFEQLKQEKKTVILVTHSMGNVERFCDRALLLNEGKIEFIGEPDEVSQRYLDLFKTPSKDKADSASSEKKLDEPAETEPNHEIKISGLQVSQNDISNGEVEAFKPFTIKFSVEGLVEGLSRVNPVVNIIDSNEQRLLISDIRYLIGDFMSLEKGESKEIEYQIEENIYTNGDYRVEVIVNIDSENGGRRKAEANRNEAKLSIHGVENNHRSLVHPKIKATVR